MCQERAWGGVGWGLSSPLIGLPHPLGPPTFLPSQELRFQGGYVRSPFGSPIREGVLWKRLVLQKSSFKDIYKGGHQSDKSNCQLSSPSH